MMLSRLLTIPLLAAPVSVALATSVHMEVMHPTCSYASGQITAVVSGGAPPYTYQWNTGDTSPAIYGLMAGTYSVLVTDALGEEVTAEAFLSPEPYQLMAPSSSLPWCTAPLHMLHDPLVSGQVNQWTVNGFPTAEMGMGSGGYAFPTDPQATWFEYTVDDGNGCTGTISGTNGAQISEWPTITVVGVEPSCTTGAFGAIHIEVNGDFPSELFYPPYIAVIDEVGINHTLVIAPDEDGNGALTGLTAGVYGLRWWIGVTAEALGGPCAIDTVWVTIPEAGDICGSLTGSSFVDADADCLRDAGEWGIPYSPLLIQPGDEYVLTDQSGHFNIPLLNGAYTMAQQDPLLDLICPATQPIPFTISPGQTQIDLANSSARPLDLRASLSGDLFRPGFGTSYALNVRNISAEPSGDATITLTLHPSLAQVNIQPVPSAINGNIITWQVPPIGPYASFNATVRVVVAVGTPLGSILSTTLEVSNTLPDADPSNNVDMALDEVVGSYDPNDKRAITSTRSSEVLYFIDQDEWIDYTIRFQNTGTFLAEFVVITDTLPAELDMITYEQGVASHPFTVSFKPGRIVEWRFDGIMLPDSTTNEPGSHGLVKFRIKPRTSLSPGTVIENVANIYFDLNEPVITEPCVLTAEFSTNIENASTHAIWIAPNPANDVLSATLPANGTGMVQIFSSDGRVINAPTTRRMNSIEVDVRALAPGTYVVRTAEGSARFVKR